MMKPRFKINKAVYYVDGPIPVIMEARVESVKIYMKGVPIVKTDRDRTLRPTGRFKSPLRTIITYDLFCINNNVNTETARKDIPENHIFESKEELIDWLRTFK